MLPLFSLILILENQITNYMFYEIIIMRLITLYNKVTLVNVLTNHEQYICYCICSSFLMLVNENTAVHCLFMLVHSALTNVNKILIKY